MNSAFLDMIPTPNLSHLTREDYRNLYEPAGEFLFAPVNGV